ncbi:Cytochrome P450 [Dillenia turbinata]|uniref:Cytochrome P450 n=1 Tax=Dillenia turbinata TaxID=194707 RepID=A0AAN8WDL5_9MAGN
MSSMSKHYGPVVRPQVGRALTQATKSCNFHESSVSVGQYGPCWRLVRCLHSTELFNAKYMDDTKVLRGKCVDNMIKCIYEESENVGSIEIAKFVLLMACNLLSNLIFSRDAAELQSIEEMEFLKLISGFAEVPDRALTETMKSCNFHESSMSVGQYSPYWRLVRRLYSTELFNAKRMNETKDLRRKCVDNMINWISEESDKVGSVEIAKFVFLMAFNLQSNLIFTHDVAELQCIEEMEFFKITSGFAEIAGLPNLSDFFPVLKPFDFQGLKKKMDRALERALSVISELSQYSVSV